MKLTVSQIKKKTVHEPFYFSKIVHVSDLEKLNNDIRKIDPVQVDGNCFMEGDQIIFSLTISGHMILPCARTLADVPFSFEIHATEIFTTADHYDEEDAENEIHPIDGEVLDLMPLIKENILLEIPYRVFSHDKRDHEQAASKGKGWAIVSDEEMEETKDENIDAIDPRLEKLSLLIDKDKDKT
ncbi:YceD family protein [Virgibacillus sp. W0181]|uniref:YceD family protein n=1 Tax=Virgibacillus sp. W0181 TaxID=3391581 RepID=UPI003F4696FE